MIKTITIFFSISLLCFVALEYRNISLLFTTHINTMKYFVGNDENVFNYNEAIFLTQKQNYLEAKSLLQPLLNQQTLHNPADIYEMYGDILYTTHGNTGDILFFYQKSLTHKEVERVQKKIWLLNNIQQWSWASMQESDNATTLPTDNSGAILRDMRRVELISSWITEKDALNIYGNDIHTSDAISRALDLLETGSTVPRDW